MSRSDLPEPIARFQALLEAARRTYPQDFNAMTLATVGPDGKPSARIVLLKGADARGFVFYTNLESRKGQELLAHPDVALCFYWPALEQQVRVEGRATRVGDEEADAYFETRARGSQLGAWASLQSQPLASRKELEDRFAEVTKRHQGGAVPRPPHWSGFLVAPERIEFWKAGTDRLHDRSLFTRTESGWSESKLYP